MSILFCKNAIIWSTGQLDQSLDTCQFLANNMPIILGCSINVILLLYNGLCWLEYGAQIGVGDGEDRKEEAFESGFKEFV